MRRGRFSEDQMIGILKEHEAGAEDGGAVSGARGERGDAVRLEEQVQRDGGRRSATAAESGRREPPSETAGSGSQLERRGAEGDRAKKRLKLAGLRANAAFAMKQFAISERPGLQARGVRPHQLSS